MELVEGQTLADRLNRGALPAPEALELGRQIAEALEAAHEKDIIHRDLKLSSVMLAPDDKVKVLDAQSFFRGKSASSSSSVRFRQLE